MGGIIGRLLGKPEGKTSYEPFSDIPEILVAQTILELQERNGSASLKSISDQISGRVATQDIGPCLKLLEAKGTVTRQGYSYTLTHNGEIALGKVRETYQTEISQYRMDKPQPRTER